MPKKPRVKVEFSAIDKLTASMRGIERKLGVFEKKHQKSFSRMSSSTSRLTKSVKGLVGAYIGFRGLQMGARFIGGITDANREFGKTIASVQAASVVSAELTADQLDLIREKSLQVGKTSIFTASQVAEGFKFMAKAGYSSSGPEKMLKSVETMTQFATATESELGRSSDILTDLMGAFDLDTENVDQHVKSFRRLSDVISATTSAANVNVEEYFGAMKKAAPTISEFGIEMEEASSIIGLLGGAGIKDTEAGRAFKTIFTRLIAPTAETKKSLESLNVSVFKTVNGVKKMRKVSDVFLDINKATAGIGDEKRGEMFNNIFGKNFISSGIKVLKLSDKQLGAFEDLMVAATKNGGATKRMADIYGNTLDGAIKALVSRWESLKLSSSEFSSTLKDAIFGVVAWFDANEKVLAQGFGTFLKAIAGTAKFVANNFGTLAAITGGVLAAGISAAAYALGFLAVTSWAALTPWLIAAAPFIAVGAAVFLLIKYWDVLIPAIKTGWDVMISGILKAIDWIWGFKDTIIKVMGIALGPIGLIGLGIYNLVKYWHEVKLAAMDAAITMLGVASKAGKWLGFDTGGINEIIKDLEGMKIGVETKEAAKRSENGKSLDASNISIDINNRSDSSISTRQSGPKIPMQTTTGYLDGFAT